MNAQSRILRYAVSSVFLVCFLLQGLTVLKAQNIGWEGETGMFVTPLAYTAPSPKQGFGKPVSSYHFLNGGGVLGDFYGISATVGAFSRLEFGYTRALHTLGGNSDISPLWNNGFNIFHGKMNIVAENAARTQWIPAISVGFMARSQVRNVGGVLQGNNTTNADFYLVGSKMITQTPIPILLNGGIRGTNAQLWGLAGNASGWEVRGFAGAGFVLRLPGGSSAVLGAEVAQQPRHPDQLLETVIPTTITYVMRLTPIAEKKLNIDFGVAQIAGSIAPGLDLDARARTGIQVVYGF